MLLKHAPSTEKLCNERRPIIIPKLVGIWTETNTRTAKRPHLE